MRTTPTHTARTILITTAILLSVFSSTVFTAQKRTLKREHDPITVTGKRLQKILGRGISDIRLLADRDGRGLKPVPYQIDKRGPDGEFIFNRRAGEPGKFEAVDELVFMARDAGGKVDRKNWPRAAASGSEIEITDPVDKSKAWVYIFAFQPGKSTAPSAERYVTCNKNCTVVDARNYIVGFSRQAPLVFDNLTIKKAGGGSGKNVIDRLKVRFHGEAKLGLKIDRNENQFTSEIIGVIEGPVRVIRRTSNRMILYGILPTPSAMSNQIFYYNSFEFPITIDLPLNLNILVRNMSLTVTSESAVMWNSRFYNRNNRKGVNVDGRMSAEENKLNHGPYDWQVVAGSAPPNTGGWLNRLLIDRRRTPADVELYYIDDINAPLPPDSVSGQLGNLGYIIKGLEKLDAGSHVLKTYMYNINPYKPGGEKKILNVLDHPLVTRIN